ncbi:hypothetical protein [Streptomyces sp. NPDC092295]|uniref:hypothetical protein n=1 Tax=Streptomyces sp. NPDC092295 TaxID=3366011 RepID=UPI00380C60F9
MSIIVEIRELIAESEKVRAERGGADAELYSELVLKVAELLGPDLKVGDVVVVPADITTASGGFVGFDGEVTAEVLAPADQDGDVLVLAQGMEQYVNPRKLQLAE